MTINKHDVLILLIGNGRFVHLLLTIEHEQPRDTTWHNVEQAFQVVCVRETEELVESVRTADTLRCPKEKPTSRLRWQ